MTATILETTRNVANSEFPSPSRSPASQFDHNKYAEQLKEHASDRWQGVMRFVDGKSPPPAQPYQVEIQVATEEKAGCPLNCVDCLGQFLRRKGGLPKDVYSCLLEDLAEMNVPSVSYSGIYTNPINDKEVMAALIRQGGRHFGVKLHAYGLGLSATLRRAIIDAALAGPNRFSYATFSKVTTNPRTFAMMCRPSSLSSEEALRQEEGNLLALFKLAEATDFPLGITLNCRVTKINGTPRDLGGLLRWFDHTPSRVRLRFTTDYLPTRAPRKYRQRFFRDLYVDPAQARQTIDEAIGWSGFNDLDRISFRPVDPDSAYDGPRCFNGLLFAAISASGKVFPCQGIASPVYDGLAYGDLLGGDRFPEIWKHYVDTYWRQPAPLACGCPHCAAACEKQINVAMATELALVNPVNTELVPRP